MPIHKKTSLQQKARTQAALARNKGRLKPPGNPDSLFDAEDINAHQAFDGTSNQALDGLSRVYVPLTSRIKINGLGAKRLETLLRRVAQTGQLSAGAYAIGMVPVNLDALCRRHPELARACREAKELHTDEVERIISDRVTNGVAQPVTFQGKLIGWSRYYSDKLAEFYLRARRPEVYSERIRHEHHKKLEVGEQGTTSIDGDPANLSRDEKREMLRLINKLQGKDDAGQPERRAIDATPTKSPAKR